jgi:ribosome-binding protein aMBF1 (putative translation factor)
MKTMSCDICGRKIMKQENLVELIEGAKIDGVSEVCKPCLEEINAQHAKLTLIVADMKGAWLRKWIGNFKAKKVAST